MTEPAQATTNTMTRVRRFDGGVAAWAVAAALLLVVAGAYRGVQASNHADEADILATSPFPLRNVPKSIDNWEMLEGSETMLDSQTTKITGSTDHIIRNYRDEMTGVTLSVLILFGPAGPVTPHTPQVCYPASGFAPVGDVIDRTVEYGPNRPADFRTSVFAKSGGRALLLQTVYHSYLLDGVWSPNVGGGKLPRGNPGVFKVQIQRRSMEREARGDNEPIEAFLTKLLPVLDRMTAEARTKPVASPTTTVAAQAK